MFRLKGMQMIKILICDDDKILCDQIKAGLEKHYAKGVNVGVEHDADRLYDGFQNGRFGNVDILLMDIRFEKINGIDVVKEIQRTYRCLKVIFITGYMDYATQIFKADPSNFLVKPVRNEKLFAAVDELLEKIREEKNDCILLQTKGNAVRVKTRDILFVESDRRVLRIYERETCWIVHKKIEEVEKELPDFFLRCHQSFLVNMDEIKVFNADKIILFDGRRVDVSKAKYREARKKFFRYVEEHAWQPRR